MDVTIPRQLIVEARLACWLQAYVNNARGKPSVGHAVASWEDKRHIIARLDVVHIQPGIPSEVREALVRAAACEVAEAGALRVVTAIDDPELRALGFRPANDGGLTLHTSRLRGRDCSGWEHIGDDHVLGRPWRDAQCLSYVPQPAI